MSKYFISLSIFHQFHFPNKIVKIFHFLTSIVCLQGYYLCQLGHLLNPLNIFCQEMENLDNWMDNLWLKVENIVAKGEIARFVTLFSKSCLLQKHQKTSIWGKGLNKFHDSGSWNPGLCESLLSTQFFKKTPFFTLYGILISVYYSYILLFYIDERGLRFFINMSLWHQSRVFYHILESIYEYYIQLHEHNSKLVQSHVSIKQFSYSEFLWNNPFNAELLKRICPALHF